MIGHADVIVAGGTESMSNVPYYIPSPTEGESLSSSQVVNGLVKDGLTDAYNRKDHMGLKGEVCARVHNIGREQQDTYTIESYRKLQVAQESSWFKDEIAPIIVTGSGKSSPLLEYDEEIKKVRQQPAISD
jgi:acetyl-CoA C-acetyltransferase